MTKIFHWLTLLATITACGASPIASLPLASRQIEVLTTVGMITDIVQNVGGNRVRVKGLMGPGVDPHLYKPSAGDALKLGNADVVFYGGLHLEGRMAELFEKFEAGDRRAYAVTAEIPVEKLRESDQLAHDPHVWFDVTLWQQATRTVARRLSELDPQSAGVYAQNAERYLQELAALDAYALAEIQKIPPAGRVMITAHDAFGYFGARYGLEVRGLQGISTASEISAADVQSLSAFIAGRKIKAIFIESSVPVGTVRAVQEAVRARGWEVVIGGELLSDAMGAAGTPEGTYIGMVKHNVDTIVGALK